MSIKGCTFTLEQRQNISDGLKGRIVTPVTRSKISASLMGHKVSDEARKKMSYKTSIAMTEERKQKLREIAIALGWPEEARKKSEEFNKNFVFTAEMRRKIGEAHRRERHYNWKGGIMPLGKCIYHSSENVGWRRRVFKRDNHTCQKCGTRDRHLVLHHKRAFSLIFSNFLRQYNQFSPIEDKETLIRLAINYRPFWNIGNGGTLCDECHEEFHLIYGRNGNNTVKQWKEFTNGL